MVFMKFVGGSSMGVHLLVYPLSKTGPPLLGMAVHSVHGVVVRKGTTACPVRSAESNPVINANATAKLPS